MLDIKPCFKYKKNEEKKEKKRKFSFYGGEYKSSTCNQYYTSNFHIFECCDPVSRGLERAERGSITKAKEKRQESEKLETGGVEN